MQFPHIIVVDDAFEHWRAEQSPIVSMDCGLLAGDLVAGKPSSEENGATLYLVDGDARSAEWFPDASTGVARLAAVMRSIEHGHDLRHHDPEGFLRWSELFFDQTVGLLSQRQ